MVKMNATMPAMMRMALALTFAAFYVLGLCRTLKAQQWPYYAGAKVVCAACHGKVCESTVLKRDIKFSMVFCVNCHKARKATVRCSACHTLSM